MDEKETEKKQEEPTDEPHIVRTYNLDVAQASGSGLNPKPERKMVFEAPPQAPTPPASPPLNSVLTSPAETTGDARVVIKNDPLVMEREAEVIVKTEDLVRVTEEKPAPTPEISTLLREAEDRAEQHLVSPVVPESTSPLHTYKGDFAEHVKTQQATPFSVLASELDAKQTTTPASVEVKKDTRLTFIGGGLLLLALIIMSGALWWSTQNRRVPLAFDIPSKVFADEQRELTGTKDDLRTTIIELRSESFVTNTVLLYTTYSTTTASGTITLSPGGLSLIAALDLGAPEILLRNIGERSTVVLIRSGGLYYPALVLDATHFERTFAGMLDWEPLIVRDLSYMYPLVETVSEFGERGLVEPRDKFVDEISDSHDVRVLYDVAGGEVLVWGYADKTTLIIARDKASFAEIISKLKTR